MKRVEFDGEDRARLAYAQGKGVLFFTGHFGYWELHAIAHGLQIEPIGVLARALDNARLNSVLEGIRQRTGNTVIYRRGAIRRVMRMLHAGHGIAILIDQHIQERDAVAVDFFERPAATTSALAALALRTGAPVVPVFALPLGAGRYRMIYERRSILRAPTATGRPRVHAAVHRRARDVRAPASGPLAVDASALARCRTVARRRSRDVPRRQKGRGRRAAMSRLVIVAPNWLGDAVMALPAIADLRRALPEATIAVAAKPAVASLFGMVRDVDEIIEKGAGRLAADIGCCCQIRSARRWTSSGPAFPNAGVTDHCRGPLLTRRRLPYRLSIGWVHQHLVRALGFSWTGAAATDVTPEMHAAGARCSRRPDGMEARRWWRWLQAAPTAAPSAGRRPCLRGSRASWPRTASAP